MKKKYKYNKMKELRRDEVVVGKHYLFQHRYPASQIHEITGYRPPTTLRKYRGVCTKNSNDGVVFRAKLASNASSKELNLHCFNSYDCPVIYLDTAKHINSDERHVGPRTRALLDQDVARIAAIKQRIRDLPGGRELKRSRINHYGGKKIDGLLDISRIYATAGHRKF